MYPLISYIEQYLKGKRPRNYLSSCPWIFHLIYTLSTSTTLLSLHFLLSMSLLPPLLSLTPAYLRTYVYLPMPT